MEAYCDARLDVAVEAQRVGQAEQAEEGHAEAGGGGGGGGGGGAGSARELAPCVIPLDIIPAIPLDITPGSAGEGARAGASGLEVAAAAGGPACLLHEHAHCCRWEAGGGRRWRVAGVCAGGEG